MGNPRSKDAGSSKWSTCTIGKYHLAPEYAYHFEEYRNQGVQGNRHSVRMAQNAKDWITEDRA
jgi:N-sulfoglucosamine sulfohydrolase